VANDGYWGSAEMLKTFRQLLIYQQLPEDATETDIITMAHMIYNGQRNAYWMPTSAIFVGPGEYAGPYQNTHRIKIFYDSSRKITDVGIG